MLRSISELAEATGFAISTLHSLTEQGVIRPVLDGPSPQFGEDAILRLQVIAKGKKLGLSVREIAALIDFRQREMPDTRQPAPAKVHERSH